MSCCSSCSLRNPTEPSEIPGGGVENIRFVQDPRRCDFGHFVGIAEDEFDGLGIFDYLAGPFDSDLENGETTSGDFFWPR